MCLQKREKKKRRRRKGVPDRGLSYCPVGQSIPELTCQLPDSFSLCIQNQELGLISDLTFTTRCH